MHSPIRSESDVFWSVLLIGLAAAFVAALGAITDTAIGALAAAVLAGAGLVLLWFRARGSLPDEVEVAPHEKGIYRVLVVANETVGGAALLREIRNRCAGRERPEILVVCPALTGSRLQHLASDTDDARREAEARLESSLVALREAGLEAQGVVGDEDPVAAAGDALRNFGVDEVIVSTHPPERSRWLERGVVEQIRRDVDLPITHVVVDRAAETAAAG